ncbi:PIN-like domain-containing protein [Micromonospora globbae]|uniref:PIN-like domain-containing protein n=1 Tax=Micromonospora globbae TaxID=1894969 RepID=UPI003867C625|nr:PIN-like domain-containing protein [Micromonospora globbae]
MTDNSFGAFKDFPGWLPQPEDTETFFASATVVLDANVLLALYRVSPTAREELLAILREVKERLWIPHQVALEFMRNREKVIADRNSRFTEVKRVIQTASERATSEIRAAVDGLNKLRAALVSLQDWDEAQHGLKADDIRKKLADLLKPAAVELERIKSDYDLKHSDIQSGDDEVLRELQETLLGRIGEACPPERIRELTEEAIEFRYPNEIPPGYLDLKTKPPARAAGDFILWTQVIDMLKRSGGSNPLIVLVTADAKSDWWLLNGKNEPTSARPELIQELYEQTHGKLLLLTLDGFLEGSRNYLQKDVSPSTVAEAREVIAEERDEEGSVRIHITETQRKLNRADHKELEWIVRTILLRMGFTIKENQFPEIDILAEYGGDQVVVEVKKAMTVPIAALFQLHSAMVRTNSRTGIIVTTGRFTNRATKVADDLGGITLIDGDELAFLFDEHLGFSDDEQG